MGRLSLTGRHASADFKPLQNPALLPTATTLAQVQQLFLQRQQPVDPRFHMVDMLVDQRIHAFALVLRTVAQIQQAADLLQGHVQAAAIADKDQPLGVRLGVHAVIGLGARRRRQQAFLLVIADGFDGAVGQFRQFADLHRGNLQMGA